MPISIVTLLLEMSRPERDTLRLAIASAALIIGIALSLASERSRVRQQSGDDAGTNCGDRRP